MEFVEIHSSDESDNDEHETDDDFDSTEHKSDQNEFNDTIDQTLDKKQ